MFDAIENAGQLENIFVFIVKFWLPLKFSEIIFHHLLEDIKTKKKKKNTSQAPSPHPQPRLRTNPTTKFGQTTIESDYQRWVPQLPPFLDYFSISLIEPMLQWWDPPTHATIELLMTPPSHQLICFSLYISHVIVNLVFSFFFFLFFFACLEFFVWICWLWIFFSRILWVNSEFFFPKWVKR